MNTTQVKETLEKYFDDNRIVVWNDDEGEFADGLSSIVPEGVELLKVEETGALAVKVLVEIERPAEKFLLYTPKPKPESHEDWLLDIRLYSHDFSADFASILINDLGLEKQSLRPFLKSKKAFFNNMQRVEKLTNWVNSSDGEEELSLKMLAAIVNVSQPDPFAIFLNLLREFVEKSDTAESKTIKIIQNQGLDGYLWDLANETFAYKSENPTIGDLLNRLFVTDLANHARESLPEQLEPLRIKDPPKVSNVAVFLANWRTNIDAGKYYKTAAAHVEHNLGDSNLEGIDIAKLGNCETFEYIERLIISDLKNGLLSPLPADTSGLRDLITKRKDSFWSRIADSGYLDAYNALASALDFFIENDSFSRMTFSGAASVLEAYKTELFKIDRNYRHFIENNRKTRLQGWDLLKELEQRIEDKYVTFIDKLAMKWSSSVEQEDLFENWKIEGMPNQYGFFRDQVKPIIDQAGNTKVYVIISDAFRYECAEELVSILNAESRSSGSALLEADLSAMLGVVPSYTALGMASLLPYQEYGYKEERPNANELFLDGKSSSGSGNRKTIMNSVGGIAVGAEELLNSTRDEGRKYVSNYEVIYIYHDEIDAIGDKTATESKTFEAVRDTIDKLNRIVHYVLDHLSGSRVFITADHGFLYSERPPTDVDRSELNLKSYEALKKKKRYVIDPDIKVNSSAWKGKIGKTSGIEGDMEFLIPKGANRFHFTGGARFVHGGAMPQEIVIPLISIKKLRGRKSAATKVRNVDVALLGNLTRVVNNVQTLRLIQTSAVSKRLLPRTIEVYFSDEDGKPISNKSIVTFESKSASMDDWSKTVQLTLIAGDYDRRKEYFLIMREPGAVVEEYKRLSLKIDIAFSSDF